MRRRALLAGVAVAVLAAACSGGSPSSSPRHVPGPGIAGLDQPSIRVHKIAGYIRARWPRIRVDRAQADQRGRVVSFVAYPDYDSSIDDLDAYEEHVQLLSEDLRQASIEMLKLAARYFPRLRFATVWDDELLRAFWSRSQILAMAPPSHYRDLHAFQRLVVTAAIPPPMLGIDG